MPRRNRPVRPAPARAATRSNPVETFRGEDYQVSWVPGEQDYRCPGCDQVIPAGRPHLVAWVAAGDGEDRRHWHTPCWAARERRTVTRQRGRGAPRY